jgi:amino acid permease
MAFQANDGRSSAASLRGIELTLDHQHPATHHCAPQTNDTNNHDGEDSCRLMPSPAHHDSNDAHVGHHHHHASNTETTAVDAWVQLTKAYIGPGCLSLPWAMSQLGLPVGVLVICIVAFWTSYNCWNVVILKRVIMKERAAAAAAAAEDDAAAVQGEEPTDYNQQQQQQNFSQHVTYPDVGLWAYNRKFRDVLLISICVQQLAVCTVFLSFVGENIAAVMERTLSEEGDKAPSHALVITLALPFALILSCLPNLKVLSPVMVVATISLFVGFGLLGVVIGEEWHHRPRPENNEIDFFDINWSQVPMAVCAILYSYEGICVILPVESAMEHPEHFKNVFVSSMSFTALVFAAVASLCVVAFGDVNNGSVTAFLVENLEDEHVKWWLYMANTACSVAVLLTYPLQLFPSFELVGPWLTRLLRLDLGTQAFMHHRGRANLNYSNNLQHEPHTHHHRHPTVPRSFSPLPSCNNPDDGIVGDHEYHDHNQISPEAITHPRRNSASGDASHQDEFGDNNTMNDDDDDDDHSSNSLPPFLAAFPTPGDSPQLRAILVSFTYIMAIAVPNVQLLVSLAGALSGSATGLIIPPLLELAYVKGQEQQLEQQHILRLSRQDADTSNSEDDDANDEDDDAFQISTSTRRLSKLQWKKWECYTLFGLGVVVCVFGTGAAMADIVRVYMGHP